MQAQRVKGEVRMKVQTKNFIDNTQRRKGRKLYMHTQIQKYKIERKK